MALLPSENVKRLVRGRTRPLLYASQTWAHSGAWKNVAYSHASQVRRHSSRAAGDSLLMLSVTKPPRHRTLAVVLAIGRQKRRRASRPSTFAGAPPRLAERLLLPAGASAPCAASNAPPATQCGTAGDNRG